MKKLLWMAGIVIILAVVCLYYFKAIQVPKTTFKKYENLNHAVAKLDFDVVLPSYIPSETKIIGAEIVRVGQKDKRLNIVYSVENGGSLSVGIAKTGTNANLEETMQLSEGFLWKPLELNQGRGYIGYQKNQNNNKHIIWTYRGRYYDINAYGVQNKELVKILESIK